MPVRARLGLVVLCLVAAGAGSLGGASLPVVGPVGAQAESFTTVLAPGFNLVGWVEAETTPSELFADLAEAEAVFGWDALGGEFLAARRSGPEFTNSLKELLPGQGFWLQIASEGPVDWVRTRAALSAPLRLWPGNNLVGWLGPDAMETEAATASVGVALETMLAFDPESGAFDRFAPSLPAALNSLTSLEHGSAEWVRTCRSATWDQSGAAAGAGIAAGTLACTSLEVGPRLELEAGLSAESMSIIREALDDARTFFLLKHDVALTDFTVRAFASTESLIDERVRLRGESRAAAEQRWSGFAVAFGSSDGIWISAGGAGWEFATEDQRHHSVVHEFFHVLQFQSGGSRGPEWLLEGSARYVEFVVSEAVGRTDLATRRALEAERALGTAATLQSMETLAGLNTVGFTAGYSSGFLATESLTGSQPGSVDLGALFDFYARTRSTSWPTAFAAAFGQSTSVFYADFEAERALGFPFPAS